MKLLAYADVQATDGNEICYNDPTIRLQDWRVRRFWQALLEIYSAKNCDGCIDLGDTTDDRSSIPVTTINSVLTNIERIPKGWHKKLIGNHEQYTRNTEVHVGKLFDRTFDIIETCEVFKFNATSSSGTRALIFCSFPADHGKLAEWVDVTTRRLRKDGAEKIALFGHFQVVGAQLNSGLAHDGFPKKLLKCFDAALLGHVHKPQALGHNHFYVGSPFQQNFGEANESKRVAIFDTDSFEIEWVSMAHYGFPEYRTVGVQDFVNLVKPDSEDRFEVVLRSQADTERLFNHPLCLRADARYEYTECPATATDAKSWTFDEVLDRYTSLNPPGNAGIELALEEVLAIGKQIATDGS